MILLCNYYLTYRCNADCEFCHFGFSNNLKNSDTAKTEDVIKNIREIKNFGVKFIDFTGGEPLLFHDIPIVLEEAKKLKYQTSITTNGILYPKFAEKIKKKVDLLHFSLDSPDEEEHNRIRKINCYGSVLTSIEIAKNLGENPDILFTVTNETYSKLPEMHKLAQYYKCILIINPVFSYFGNPGLSMDAIDFIKTYIKGKSDIYINPSFLRLRERGGNKIHNPSCKAVSRVIVISPKNEILLPCYHLSQKAIKIEKSISEIINSEVYKSYYNLQGQFNFCNGCTINCYFEPSFAFPTNLYGLISVKSKLIYMYHKLIKQKI